MISCTDFIPAYSEFFKYLEEKHGFEEVKRFWETLFTPDGKGIPLVNFVAKSGIRGCFDYWAGSLNEEAADFTMYLNEKRGFFRIVMHHCPSKGRLLEAKDAIGLTPYANYCLHCDYYRSAVEMHGLKYLYDFTKTDQAACSILIYDPNLFDGRIIIDPDTLVMDRKAAENEYFHKDFHHSLSRCLHYTGEKFGDGELRAMLEQYAHNALAPVIAKAKKEGLGAVEEHIRTSYEKEKAEKNLKICRGEKHLTVSVTKCPVVEYMTEKGYEISPWFEKSTEYVMAALAKECGFSFQMEEYDRETGRSRYTFEVK